MRSQILPNGGKLLFDGPAHVYTIEGVGKCQSVTTILNQIFPFDTEGISKKVAEKAKMQQSEVLAQWTSRATLGTNVHAFIEQKILKQALPPRVELEGSESLFYPAADKASSLVLESYEPLAVELMIASPRYKLAGTIDFLGKNRKTGAILIGDWKTTGSMPTSFRLSSTFNKPAEPPLSHLVNDKMCRYALQTLIYGHLLKTEGYGKLIDGAIDTLPLEFGLIKFGPQLDGSVSYEFVGINPGSIVPVCLRSEVRPQDVIEDVLAPYDAN